MPVKIPMQAIRLGTLVLKRAPIAAMTKTLSISTMP